LLTYELHNANPYGSVTFNFTTEPVDGFIKFLWPYQATVGAGGSVQVIITASAGSLRIRQGSSHTFTVTANQWLHDSLCFKDCEHQSTSEFKIGSHKQECKD